MTTGRQLQDTSPTAPGDLRRSENPEVSDDTGHRVTGHGAKRVWSALDRRRMRSFWLVASAVLAVQLVALVAYSAHLYSRFDVSVDFAHNAQAWYLIGHGNLSPTDTVRITPTPFWRDHFDLVLWPLSLLRFVYPHPVVLLCVQDVAIVAAEVVTLFWIVAVLDEHLTRYRNVAALVALVALVANSWWYEAASFDIHMPPLGLPFVVLGAFSFWSGRFRRALVALAISLLFGSVVVELVVAVGLAALCSSRVRRAGGLVPSLAVVVFGAVWIVVVTAIGANQASNLAANYGYLANTTQNVSSSKIVRAVLEHPHRLVHALGQRWRALLFELLPTGFLGLITPWGFWLFLGLLVPIALAASSGYSNATGGAFQNLPAMPFILVGSVMVLARIASSKDLDEERVGAGRGHSHEAKRPIRRIAPVIAAVLALAATGVAVGQGALMIGRIPGNWLLVSNRRATTLDRALDRIPTSAEVVASYGIIGRFSQRKYVLTLAGGPQPFKVYARDIYFVVTPSIGVEPLPAAEATADVRFLQREVGAKTVIDSSGVYLLQWHAPADVTGLTLPGLYPSQPLHSLESRRSSG